MNLNYYSVIVKEGNSFKAMVFTEMGKKGESWISLREKLEKNGMMKNVEAIYWFDRQPTERELAKDCFYTKEWASKGAPGKMIRGRVSDEMDFMRED